MADRQRRTTISDLNISRGGYSPLQRAIQSELARTPGAFDYSQLDEKYPMRQVTPMVPSYIQQEMEEDRIAQKEKEVALRVRQAQLNNYDSELNEKNAIAEQVIAARPEFALLNPQDEDFQEKADQLLIKYPMLESSDDFMRGTFARLSRINERAMSKKKPKTPEALTERVGKAMTEKAKFLNLQKEGVIDPNEAKQYIGMLDQNINEAMKELGMQPMSSAQKPALAPPAGTSQKNISPKNQEALQWLEQNPDDPRAGSIRAKLQKQGIL